MRPFDVPLQATSNLFSLCPQLLQSTSAIICPLNLLIIDLTHISCKPVAYSLHARWLVSIEFRAL